MTFDVAVVATTFAFFRGELSSLAIPVDLRTQVMVTLM